MELVCVPLQIGYTAIKVRAFYFTKFLNAKPWKRADASGKHTTSNLV